VTTRPPAVLVLEDGRVFPGESYGAVGEVFGEAVFTTGMTGYQETLTDPSYHRQIVVMTAPQIGNTGLNDEDAESDRIWPAGFVVRDPARTVSSWRARRALEPTLAAAGVVGLAGVDTRALTRHLRDRGTMRAGLSSVGTDPETLHAQALRTPPTAGADLVGQACTPEPYVVPALGRRRFAVTALDLGVKRSTLRRLAAAGCEVRVLPAASPAADLLDGDPDGVFLSNGPGDPATASGPVAAVRAVLAHGTPVFGICFGHQVLARAVGLSTYQLRFGHRGVNAPVQDRATGRVLITSHNHGFAVAAPADGRTDTPYGEVEVSHVGLNDGVIEGLRCREVRAFGVQFHPESAPGPHDAAALFERFAELMARVPAAVGGRC